MEKPTNKKSQMLWDEYKQDMTKNWNKIWFLVIDICKSLVLKYCKQRRLSFHDDLIYTRSMDAATTIMGRIKKGKSIPENIVTYCYWPVFWHMANEKVRQEDRESVDYQLFLNQLDEDNNN